MSKIEEIVVAIEQLSPEDRAELDRRVWPAFDAWDQQIAKDVKSGKLDKVLQEVDEDIRAGRLRDLP